MQLSSESISENVRDARFNQRHSTESTPSDTARALNTALLTVAAKDFRSCSTASANLPEIMNSDAFEAIAASVKKLASSTGKSEVTAAEEIVRAFRNLEGFWMNYLVQEGMKNVRSQTLSS